MSVRNEGSSFDLQASDGIQRYKVNAPPSDDVLIEEARRGSPAAFDLLMRRHERLVYRVAWGYTRERESALDVTQEVFFKAYRKLAAYRGEGVFRAWLIRIACREGLNWVRGHRRAAARITAAEAFPRAGGGRQADLISPADMIASARPPAPAGWEPEASLVRAEDIRELHDGIGRLPARQRLAVILRYFEGLPVRETAAALGCTEGTAKSILFRSLQSLRGHLLVRERRSER